LADKLCFVGNMYFSQVQYSGLQGQCQLFCRPWFVITALITACFNFLLDIEACMIYSMLCMISRRRMNQNKCWMCFSLACLRGLFWRG